MGGELQRVLEGIYGLYFLLFLRAFFSLYKGEKGAQKEKLGKAAIVEHKKAAPVGPLLETNNTILIPYLFSSIYSLFVRKAFKL